MPIPIHAEWKALKEKHGVPDGAVSGMNLGKVLDTYHSHPTPGGKLVFHLFGALA